MNYKKAIAGLKKARQMFPNEGEQISANYVLEVAKDRWTAYFGLYSKGVVELHKDNYEEWINFVNIVRSYPE